MSNSIIDTGMLNPMSLKDSVVLLTGGAGGIGLEAAKAILWLGGTVIIVDNNKIKLHDAKQKLYTIENDNRVFFVDYDITDMRHVKRLKKFIKKNKLIVNTIINNATVAHMGNAHKVPISHWDHGYQVNIRGCVLLLQQFLPSMIENNSGTIVFVPSSGAAPYMGAYEVFKTAQVELGNTLYAELEHTNINVYSIGPGYVRTDTAVKASKTVCNLMGLTEEEFSSMNERHTLSCEEAGVGFAASLVFAETYNGQEVGSIQALMDANIEIVPPKESDSCKRKQINMVNLETNLEKILLTFKEQSKGWSERSVFEKQWIRRDFKKKTGLSPEQMKDKLNRYVDQSHMVDSNWEELISTLKKLRLYYIHQKQLLLSYEKDKAKLEEHSKIINTWIKGIDLILSPSNKPEESIPK